MWSNKVRDFIAQLLCLLNEPIRANTFLFYHFYPKNISRILSEEAKSDEGQMITLTEFQLFFDWREYVGESEWRDFCTCFPSAADLQRVFVPPTGRLRGPEQDQKRTWICFSGAAFLCWFVRPFWARPTRLARTTEDGGIEDTVHARLRLRQQPTFSFTHPLHPFVFDDSAESGSLFFCLVGTRISSAALRITVSLGLQCGVTKYEISSPNCCAF